MRVATGKVVAGKVVVGGAPFEEGAEVTVIAADATETFELGPEDEAALLGAIDGSQWRRCCRWRRARSQVGLARKLGSRGVNGEDGGPHSGQVFPISRPSA